MNNRSRRQTDARTASHDADVKRIIISAVVSAAMGLVVVMAALAATGEIIPDQIDRLATLALGALIGFIGKAGLEKWMEAPVPVTNVPGEAIKTEEIQEKDSE